LATQKKQYIEICSLKQDSSTGRLLKFSELASLLNIKVDDVEEWAITAINNDIIDARIDQMNEEIVIKTSRLRQLNNDEWLKVKGKITSWKQRFAAIENVLKH
jgi:translation initiation factor 3 subunit M